MVLRAIECGRLFAWRYQSTGSAALTAIEHALYGNLAFTIGFSRYLYHASTRTAGSLVAAEAPKVP
jgi:hypothetical protein